MAERDPTMSERVVKEAVGRAMETPMRDAVVEAVEESAGARRRRRSVGVASAFVAIGAVGGYLAGVLTGRRDIGESIVEEVEEQAPTLEPVVPIEEEPTGGASRLRRIAIALGIVAAAGLVRRWMRSEEADEWEAIESFGEEEDEGALVDEEGEGEAVGDPDESAAAGEEPSTEFDPVDADPGVFDSPAGESTGTVDETDEGTLGDEDEQDVGDDEEPFEEDEE